MSRVTPVRQQYLDIKAQYQDCILFFRLGDFYEMFDEDAEVAARELDLTLTARTYGKSSDKVPMAGVPHHAAETYIARLVEKGYHVAICEQMTQPDGRGPVEREVVRVITPGTIIEADMLPEDEPNYLLAVLPVGDAASGVWQQAGVAYADISTGEFAATQFSGDNVGLLVLEELARLNPREVIVPESWASRITLPEGMHMTSVPDWRFEFDTAQDALMHQFRVRTLDGYGLSGQQHAISAAGAVLMYLRDTQMGNLAQITTIRAYSTANFMVLDQFTRRNLELTRTIRGGTTRGSLLGVLDHTVTAMGARLLHTWINQPLLDIHRLNARLDAVESLTQNEAIRLELLDALKRVSDIERLTNRLLVRRAGPRDLIGLKSSLEVIPLIRDLIGNIPALVALLERLDPCDEVREHIARALVDEPPATLNTIGIIRQGYSKELDDIINRSAHARDWIANLEPIERERTGIPTLKVGYNKVFGYYIEVTHAHTSKIPDDYIRKQTLVNAERYITPELKDYETLVLNAEEQILSVERDIFEALCNDLSRYANSLIRTARAIAHLDVFLSLATVALREGYVRPVLTEDDTLIIRDGRHPVVEKLLDKGVRYVSNDTHFDSMNRIHIITGPNMSGKSTYIRQVAIITLMAQIGSFVPADEATIGLVDRIFARIGAQDEIHAGQSTFMVEMVETARLLSGSTRRSLLILDEVGRGTSTYDGLAIARAVLEYIHNNPRLDCRTLFATHYHELTDLPNVLPRTRNYNVAVTESGEDVVFLHKVVPGGADRSYGVHVAQLAGMPRPVVERARELLAELEQNGNGRQGATNRSHPPQQMSFFDVKPHPALEALKALQPDNLSPIEALTKLYELKRLMDD
ncbi:MAG: DNA mismatch repair protein MutS [Phototrophicales bacterium]|nr:MAG: DNA mismatch repair protein MutS [Phototrophicales bacterium]RMG75602.1 MAG: DNA mismatch repair protein MutS [Chloroflexota bacterium]